VAAAVPYSALQSRGGDGFFTFDPGVSEGGRTVFPCTKSAVIVGGAVARCGLFNCRSFGRGVWVNNGTTTNTYFADGTFTRGRPEEPSSTVRGV
jgi:hypothetical protein